MPSNSGLPPLPSSCICPSVVSEPSSRTPTGRRCSLYYCIILAPGHHVSHSLHCSLNFNSDHSAPLFFANSAPQPSVHSNSYSNNASTTTTMPRRHHMRYRRGSGRGKASRPPLSNRSDSSSPSLEDLQGRYPATRSGRGRNLASRRSHSLTPVRISSPPRHHPTSHFSPSLPHLKTLASPSNVHTAQFHYSCTLDRPRITATISISFKEEASQAASPRPRKLLRKSTSDSTPLPPVRNPEASPVAHGAPASSSKSKGSTNTGSSGRDSSSEEWSGDDGGMGSARTVNALPGEDANADDTKEYRCLIVEETPHLGNDT